MAQTPKSSEVSPGRDPEREVDWFLPAVGAVGLGLVALLVYIYWP